MKKTLSISLLIGFFTAATSFGQGYFAFATGKSAAYDGFTTPGSSTVASGVQVAMLWASASTVSSVVALTGLSNSPTSGNSTTAVNGGVTAAQIWSSLLSGSWTAAVDNGNSASVVSATSATGVVTYNSGGSFGVTGTSVGTTYSVMLIGWGGGWATAALAAANGAAVGWSTVQQITSVASNGTATPFAMSKFGVFTPAVVPEPGTIALAGLGGLGLLALRRRNK